MNALLWLQVWLRPALIYGTLFEKLVPFYRYVDFIIGIFQKLHMLHLICKHYKRCHLGGNRSLIEGSLHGERSTFSVGGIFLKLQAPCHLCIRKNRCKFGCHLSVNKGTLFAERSATALVPQSSIMGIILKFHT